MGGKRPFLDILDKYYKADSDLEVLLGLETCAPTDSDDARACGGIVLAWLKNGSLSCASAAVRRLRSKAEVCGDTDRWGVARRGDSEISRY